MPVRKITNHGGRKFIGKFPSIKMGKMISWESPLERDYIQLQEWDSNVLSYKEQPLRIRMKMGNDTFNYTPDFWVERTDGIELVEVKSSRYLNTPQAKMQVKMGTEFCGEEGLRFRLVTEKDIREGHLLGNVKLLLRYSRMKVSLFHIHAAVDTLTKRGPMTIDSLNQEMSKFDESLSIVYHLIFKKYLHVNLTNEPLTRESLIEGGVWEVEDSNASGTEV